MHTRQAPCSKHIPSDWKDAKKEKNATFIYSIRCNASKKRTAAAVIDSIAALRNNGEENSR